MPSYEHSEIMTLIGIFASAEKYAEHDRNKFLIVQAVKNYFYIGLKKPNEKKN
jgi:hypothetical protein